MTTKAVVLVWLGLLVLLGAELGMAKLLGWSGVAPFIGLAMAALVAGSYMRLGSGPPLVRIFALAGVFWLMVLMGLGGLDAFTRRDIPVSLRTEP